jgi:alkylation response protein AidB-like acyl-CoA dehydrogenase
MTYAAIPALRHAPALAAEWEPRLLDPDPKTSALCGMAMTEKQGGSDVRANTTRAEPLGGGTFELIGHKWFCSHPASDAFLVLAQAPEELSCFLLPRFLPDGRNGFHIQRLKDKLGTRALASAEVEFDAAVAWLVGEEGRGVPTIIDMVNHTRLDCVLASAAWMRRVMAKEPRSFEAVLDEIELGGGLDERLDRAIADVQTEIASLARSPQSAAYVARRAVEHLALTLQGSLVVRHLPDPVAEAFLASRIAGDRGLAFGTLPPGIDAPAIIDRHRPRLTPAG